MGYRSDVVLVLDTKHSNDLIYQFYDLVYQFYQSRHDGDLFDRDYVEIVENESQTLFHWSDVKWSPEYAGVKLINAFLTKHPHALFKLGEDPDDVSSTVSPDFKDSFNVNFVSSITWEN